MGFRSLQKPMYRHPKHKVQGYLSGFQGDLNSVDTDDSPSKVFRL